MTFAVPERKAQRQSTVPFFSTAAILYAFLHLPPAAEGVENSQLRLAQLEKAPDFLMYKKRTPKRCSFYTPSGTRTLDTLIKSQVLYQLS